MDEANADQENTKDPNVKEIKVSNRKLVDLILDTLDSDLLHKIQALGLDAQTLISENPISDDIRKSAIEAATNLERTLEVARVALRGEQVPIFMRTINCFDLNPESPNRSQEDKPIMHTINPKKAADCAYLANLICATVENTVRNQLAHVNGYSEALGQEAPDLKSQTDDLRTSATTLSSQTVAIERAKNSAFRGEAVKVRTIAGRDLLTS